jgi:hypothetical protein
MPKVAVSKEDLGFDSALDEAKVKGRRKKKDSEPQTIDEARETDLKMVIGAIAFIIIGVAIFVFIGSAVNVPPPTVEQLHEMNLKGELDIEEGYLYNGFSFVKHEDLWHTQLKDGQRLYSLTLRYGPKEVETIPIGGPLNESFFSDPYVFITFDPLREKQKYVGLAAAELSLSLSTAINKQPLAACTVNETDACKERPIITCEGAERAVILLDEKGPAKVSFEGNCIRVQGSGFDLLKAENRLLYQWYGIIRD